MSTIQLNRSKNGTAPSALADGELFVEQLNGRMYWADATGTLHYTTLLPQNVTASQLPGFTGDVTAASGSNALAIANNAVTLTKMATANFATTAQFLNNTSGLITTPDIIWGSGAFVTINYASVVNPDMSTFINAKITLTGNMTLGTPSNAKPGQSGAILLTQDATGSRILTYSSVWATAGGVDPPLSTAAGTVDRLDYLVVDSTHIHYSLAKAVA